MDLILIAMLVSVTKIFFVFSTSLNYQLMHMLRPNNLYFIMQILTLCIQKFMRAQKKMIHTQHCGDIEPDYH